MLNNLEVEKNPPTAELPLELTEEYLEDNDIVMRTFVRRKDLGKLNLFNPKKEVILFQDGLIAIRKRNKLTSFSKVQALNSIIKEGKILTFTGPSSSDGSGKKEQSSVLIFDTEREARVWKNAVLAMRRSC